MTERGLDMQKSALLLIDLQQGFNERDERGDNRNNHDAVANIVRLIAAFRGAKGRVIHVRHASTEPESVFRPERPGYAGLPETGALGDEPVLVKQVNSGFIGTDLESRLREAGVETLVTCGATTNHCVETTARMAANLGFKVQVVRDGTWAYDQTGPDGEHYSADAVHAMSLANLKDEFATIVTAADVLTQMLPAQSGTTGAT